MVTVNEIKRILPDELLVLLTDELDTGLINVEKLQEMIDNATEYFKAKLPGAAEAIIDEAVRNYVLARLYAYAGNIEMARTYEEMWRLEEQTFYTAMRAKREQESTLQSINRVVVNSETHVFTDEEFELW